MDDEWWDREEECPKCGHYPTRSRSCTGIGCDDGYVDMYEHDDPLLFDPGEVEMCDECFGVGVLHWCPNCGHDFNLAAMIKLQKAAFS